MLRCVVAGVSTCSDKSSSLHADVSIRQHTSACVSIRQHASANAGVSTCSDKSSSLHAYVSIRQHTSAYVSMRQRMLGCRHAPTKAPACTHTSAYVSIRQRMLREDDAHVEVCGGWGVDMLRQKLQPARILQHTSAYVSIRQHTSAYVSIR
jgi:hypothetical protein